MHTQLTYYRAGSIVIPNVHMEKRSHRAVRTLAEHRPASQSWG